jgi:hypothetical protein
MGRTRSEREENMRKEWGSTMSDENLDKCKFLERKIENFTGSKHNFLKQHRIEEVI